MRGVLYFINSSGEHELMFVEEDSFKNIKHIGIDEYENILPSEQYRELTFWLGAEEENSNQQQQKKLMFWLGVEGED